MYMDFPGGSDNNETTCNEGDQDPLKQGLATHSGILAWKTPWKYKPVSL